VTGTFLRALSCACYFFGVRLGTCIALELAVAAGAVLGAAAGVIEATRLAADHLAAPEARAATTAPPAIAPLPRAELRVVPPAPVPATVFGAPDAELLAPLGAAEVTRARWNHGGTSISLRLDFANGARAAFKPVQVQFHQEPRREIAAYRLDRLLEIGRVPPAKAGVVSLADVIAGLDPSVRERVAERLRTEVRIWDGMMHGELSWWIPEIRPAQIGPHLVDEPAGRARWIAYLQVGAEIPPEVRPLVESLSACVLFDVLTDNPDRWSGNNAVTSPDGAVFYIMDNTMSFSTARIGHERSAGTLRRIQVFPRGLVERIRALTEEQIAEAMQGGSGETRIGPLLTPDEIRAVIHRRDHMLKYIDQLVAAHGEPAVLAFP
jgi:hypothetical protein